LSEGKVVYGLVANVPMEEGRVADLADNPNVFQIILGKKTWTLCFANANDKQNWLKDVKNIKNDLVKKRN